MPLTTIKFPVLRSLKIEHYQMFPGKDQKGLTYSFLPGITVIAGINGLGKTTLLNMILRALTGPEEPRKFDPSRPIPKSREMSIRDDEYFARRVSDRAVEATVEAEFAFGKDIARVKRRLRDLRIEELWLNGRAAHDPNKDLLSQQQSLQSSLVTLSGAADQYDFFFLIYAFTFSLEEKSSLIWHQDGQYQIFRILFLPPERAKKLSELEVQALSLDSDYRNRRNILNKRKEEILKAEKLQKDVPKLRRRAERLQIDVDKLDEQLQSWSLKFEEIAGAERERTELLEKLYLDIEEERRRFEGMVETYFAGAFPNLPDSVKVILGQLYSKHGCLVCGNPKPAYPEQFESRAKKGLCPFCGTDTKSRGHVVSLSKTKAQQVNASEQRLSELRKGQAALLTEIRQLNGQKEALYTQRVRWSEQRLRLTTELENIRAKLPLSKKELAGTLTEIRDADRKLAKQREEMTSVKRAYEVLLKEANEIISTAQQKLTERFNFYASEFLAEECTLNWSPKRDTLGEEGPFIEFPRFTVQMTTAFSLATGVPRNKEADVSESQKEFIDLAFRMALFDIVTGKAQPAMLVIETPEASLDLVFVGQAGRLLRKFAVADPHRPNLVIATTNLNRENMLRALLGLDNQPTAKTKREAPNRVINLLEEAAPNAALRKYGTEYRRELRKALRTV